MESCLSFSASIPLLRFGIFPHFSATEVTRNLSACALQLQPHSYMQVPNVFSFLSSSLRVNLYSTPNSLTIGSVTPPLHEKNSLFSGPSFLFSLFSPFSYYSERDILNHCFPKIYIYPFHHLLSFCSQTIVCIYFLFPQAQVTQSPSHGESSPNHPRRRLRRLWPLYSLCTFSPSLISTQQNHTSRPLTLSLSRWLLNRYLPHNPP